MKTIFITLTLLLFSFCLKAQNAENITIGKFEITNFLQKSQGKKMMSLNFSLNTFLQLRENKVIELRSKWTEIILKDLLHCNLMELLR